MSWIILKVDSYHGMGNLDMIVSKIYLNWYNYTEKETLKRW